MGSTGCDFVVLLSSIFFNGLLSYWCMHILIHTVHMYITGHTVFRDFLGEEKQERSCDH